MKTRLKSVICLTMICGSLLLLAISCKKEDDDPETVTDIDGNVYSTVTIGTQVWLTENLKTSKLNDGADAYISTQYMSIGMSVRCIKN